MRTVTVSVDAMGGDHGLSIVIPACIAAVKKNKNLNLLLVGDEQQITEHLLKKGMLGHAQLSIVHAPEVVAMDELPSHALRSKKKILHAYRC